MLVLKNIKKDYVTSSETVRALKGIDIAFRDREFVSILGPSGCGKTTLLNIIGGLDRYTSGDLVINGRSTKLYRDRDWDVYRNHRVGFIFQSYNLIPHQTVLGNVELALTIAGIPKEERVARSKAALDKVGLAGQYYKRPNQLSGGQCQRVAIARALVNDPEILLADEPTGALDTVTSVQIMNLIREIAGERLVIMVTHNPELAEEYSTRIVRLLDGELQEDTNPVSAEELAAAEAAIAEASAEEATEATEATAEKEPAVAEVTTEGSADESRKTLKKAEKAKQKKRKEKAKMSFFTAFRLSARNLISKKGRTSMIGIAGSIGIIGIAMVLAFSAGIRGYIASMQDDMLSGNPITITRTAYDLNSITGLMESMTSEDDKSGRDKNSVYVNSIIESLVEMNKNAEDIVMENEITEAYVNYVLAMDESYYKAMMLGYGIDMTVNIYTDFRYSSSSTPENISLHRLLNVAKSVLAKTEIAEQAESITSLAPSLKEMPNNSDYILSQYELVGEGSRLATEKDEIMLVLNPDGELSDMLLARLGYFTEEEVLEIVKKAQYEALPDSEKDENNKGYSDALYKEKFSYAELLNKEFVWYPNDTVFEAGEPMVIPGVGTIPAMYQYNSESSSFVDSESNGALPLKVVGILIPKDTVSFGSLTSGIYYTKALTDHVLEKNADSNIEEWINSEEAKSLLAKTFYNLPYSYTYSYDTNGNGVIDVSEDANGNRILDEGEDKNGNGVLDLGETYRDGTATIGPDLTMNEMLLLSRVDQNDPDAMAAVMAQLDTADMLERFARKLGGVSLASSITIYPNSFDEKHRVTDYLDGWNEELPEGKTHFEYADKDGNTVRVARDDKHKITYTDAIELMVNLINTMIDIVTVGLIAFTSVSLVVSTVMIGIITYVSVVERIKEIGVIRSLGGRKRDVSNLFIAETFIIGLLAGLIGVGFTYLASTVVNIILKPIIGYGSIAALPLGNAIFLVILSVGLTLISGLMPASSAARKDPVVALRTE
ncbi:MAG: ABC transporter ATP-binding protein/permease [Clostridia bacterium]|nr:ABC transporter ATP-binding protein/permease [Clostridia bacterium]